MQCELKNGLLDDYFGIVSFHDLDMMTNMTLNSNQLITICASLQLGKPLKAPLRVEGGLLHVMWRVDTDHSSYAIKQLSQDIDLKNESNIRNYNLTEHIASLFAAKRIPAISALKNPNHDYLYLFEKQGFLIYPWLEAKSLDVISESHAVQISKILAKMHNIHLHVPKIPDPEFSIHSHDDILESITKSENAKSPFLHDLKQKQAYLLEANTSYQNSLSILRRRVVVSHGDLDPKNVLWDGLGNPYLIDWESARKLNPVYEIVNASLD